MRKILIATAAAALSAASFPALAQESDSTNSSAAQPSTQRARGGDERRICVNERVSESRMTRRICRTARQWREMNDTDFDR